MNDKVLRANDGRNAFEYFGVPFICEDDKLIKGVYRKKALSVHPDKNPTKLEWANKEFKLVNNFYHMIENAKQRKIYREHLEDETEYSDDETEGRDTKDGEDDDNLDDIMNMYRNGTLFDDLREDREFEAWFDKDPILCCQKCKKLGQKDNDRLLICEMCEVMFHQRCYYPPILTIDRYFEWFCTKCIKLNERLRSLPLNDNGSNEKQNSIIPLDDAGSNDNENSNNDERDLQETVLFNPLMYSTPNPRTNIDSSVDDTFYDCLSSSIAGNNNDDSKDELSSTTAASNPSRSTGSGSVGSGGCITIREFANETANGDNLHRASPLVRRCSKRLIDKNNNKQSFNDQTSRKKSFQTNNSPVNRKGKRKLTTINKLEPRSKKLKAISKRFTKPAKPIHYWPIKNIKDHIVCTKNKSNKTVPNLSLRSQVFFVVEWKEDESKMVCYNDSLVPDHNINADDLVDAYINRIRCKKVIPCKKLSCKCNHCSSCRFCELTKTNYAGPNKIAQQISTFKRRKCNNAETLTFRGRRLTRKQLSRKPIMARKKIEMITGRVGYRSIHNIKYKVLPNYTETISLVRGQPISLKMFQPTVFTPADKMYSPEGNITNCAETVYQHLFNAKLNAKNLTIISSNLRQIFETFSKKNPF